jgi:hypothetical protein
MHAYSRSTPERVDQDIEEALVDFSNEVLEEMGAGELGEYKKSYLCSCAPMCTWFSSGHDINYLAQAVTALNMNNFGTKLQVPQIQSRPRKTQILLISSREISKCQIRSDYSDFQADTCLVKYNLNRRYAYARQKILKYLTKSAVEKMS